MLLPCRLFLAHARLHALPHVHPPSLCYPCSRSGTAIGLKCKDGVILAVENLMLSKLLVSNSNRRTYNVGSHISIAVAGVEEG